MQKTEETVNMELNGMATKILNPIEKNANLIGAGLRLIQAKTPLMDSISRLLGGNVHAPDFAAFFNNVKSDSSYAGAVMAIIGGELAQSSGMGPLKKSGSALSKAAAAYLIIGLAENLLYFSTHSPGYPGTNGGSSVNSAGYSY